jgi:hypothetical protein
VGVRILRTKAHTEVELLIRRGGGLISRRDYPALSHTMAWLVRQGKLVPVLPGIYAPPELAHHVEVLMRAVCLRHSEAGGTRCGSGESVLLAGCLGEDDPCCLRYQAGE